MGRTPGWVWRLPLAGLLAVRGLRSARREAFANVLALVAVGGIAVGVAALVLALAALAGLQEALTGEILERTPHLEIVPPPGSDHTELATRLAAVPGVVGVQRLARGRGWLLVDDGVEAVEITGHDGLLPRSFPRATAATSGLYVPDLVAVRWGLDPGEAVRLVSPRPTLGPLGPQPRTREVTFVGSFEAGRTEEVLRVAVPLAIAESLFGRDAGYLEVTAAGLDEAIVLAEAVEAAVPGAQVATWRDLNAPLFFALRLEKTVLFLAVGLVVVVAALGLVAELALLVATRREEILTLAALGTAPATLRRAFVGLGLLVATVAAVVGGAVGVGVSIVLDRTQAVALSSSAFFLDHVPFRLEALDLVLVVGLTLALATAAGLFVTRPSALGLRT